MATKGIAEDRQYVGAMPGKSQYPVPRRNNLQMFVYPEKQICNQIDETY